MSSIQSLYNGLDTLEVANSKLLKHNPQQLLPTLGPLLKKYDYKYGICLVHRHCELEDGEIMISTGNIAQPERAAEYYPDRWLATGEAYEFSDEPSEAPPQDLLEEFQNYIQGIDVLGLFYVREVPEDGYVFSESTHGRKNVLETVRVDDPSPKLVASYDSAWVPGHPNRTMSTTGTCCTCSGHSGDCDKDCPHAPPRPS